MIPLKLQIKNFLSYGPSIQTIDFTPYHLIALSGKNGHGKSALLDAITWTIWGQARKVAATAKADAHLLRLGQTQMMTALDFEFNAKTYRIRREYAQTYGKPYAALDFGIVDTQTNAFISLTDKTIRDTQTKIETTLGLDYDSFINSSFLRQGQSNEFSKKTPKERKEILANILSLGHYEILRKRALEKAKAAHLSYEHLQHLQKNILLELEQLPTLREEIRTAECRLQELCAQEVRIAERLVVHDTEKQDIYHAQQQEQVLAFQIEHHATQQKNLREKLRSVHVTWHTIHVQQLTMPDPHTIEVEKKTALAHLNHHQAVLHKHLQLKELYLQHKASENNLVNALNQEYNLKISTKQIQQAHVESTLAAQQNMLNEYTDHLKRQCLEIEHTNLIISQLYEQLKEMPAHYNTNTALEKQFEKRKMFYYRWIAQAQGLQQEQQQILQKSDLTHNENDPSCPLCEQNLSASRKKFLKHKFLKQASFLEYRYQKLNATIKRLKTVLIEQHTALETLKKTTQEYQLMQVKYDELIMLQKNRTQALQEMEKEAHQLQQQYTVTTHLKQAAHDALSALQQASVDFVANNGEYQKIQTACQEVLVALKDIAYSQEEHAKAQALVTSLEQQNAHHAHLMQEISVQKQRKVEMHELCVKLKILKKEIATVEEQKKSFTNLSDKIVQHQFIEELLMQENERTKRDKEKVLTTKGALENQRLRLQAQELECAEHKHTITELHTTIEDYTTIAASLSKDGIQAILIEDAIPEIEAEANAILGQLTDNQAHVFIESLRDLKKGGTKETLDIKISDAAGMRPYELFSGGEAFKIDFALRIAISKLLARRAGTSLQTLIIDEGFGSQDEDGLHNIMEALYKIQESFCKIIIVSHLPSMKEHFPVHFQVEKGPEGSVVRVFEQG